MMAEKNIRSETCGPGLSLECKVFTSANAFALALAGPAGAVAAVAVGKEELDTIGDENC